MLEKNGRVARGSSMSDARVRILSYRLDFEYCWSTGEGEFLEWIHKVGSPNEHPAVIVLVNDGLPASRPAALGSEAFDAPDLSSSVTPYDWVIALLSRLCARAGTNPVHLQLHLFDPWASDGPSAPFGSRTLRLLAPEIPGLHLYHATCEDEEAVERLIRDNSPVKERLLRAPLGAQRLLANLGIGYGGTATTATIQLGQEPPWLANLRARWTNHLTAPMRRHSVSNLVAPIVLARGLEALGGSLKLPDLPDAHLCRALESLVEAVSLAPAVRPRLEERGKSPREGWWAVADTVVQADIFKEFEDVAVLLVDDHAGRGYDKIVRAALGGSSEAPMPPGWSLHAVRSPEPLLAYLDGLLGLSEPNREWQVCSDCGGRLRTEAQPLDRDALRVLGGGPGIKFDILVLDLRLFDENKPSGEQGFVHRLLDVYHALFCGRQGGSSLLDALAKAAKSAQLHVSELAARDRKGATRDGLDNPPQGQASAVVAVPEQVAERIEHLALLPLLLSAVDPSLPIVLFSTTRQRRLVELLDAAPNIIKTFAKPAMTGAAPEMSAEDAALSLVGALRRALRLHEVRSVWRALVRRHNELESPSAVQIANFVDKNSRLRMNYSVDRRLLAVLASEYCNTLLQNRFADAMQVPGNWLDMVGNGATGRAPQDHRLAEMGRCLLASGSPDFSALGIALAVAAYIENALGVSKAKGPLRSYVKEPTEQQARGIATLFEAPMLLPRGPEELLRELGSKLSVDCASAAASSDLANSTPTQPDPKGVLEDHAFDAVFGTITGLRNLRAHYTVRPEHDAEVRDMAIFLWRWTIHGATQHPKGLLEPGTADVTEAARGGIPVVPSGYDGDEVGRGAALAVLSPLCRAACTWLKIVNEPLRKALPKIVGVDPPFEHVPKPQRERSDHKGSQIRLRMSRGLSAEERKKTIENTLAVFLNASSACVQADQIHVVITYPAESFANDVTRQLDENWLVARKRLFTLAPVDLQEQQMAPTAPSAASTLPEGQSALSLTTISGSPGRAGVGSPGRNSSKPPAAPLGKDATSARPAARGPEAMPGKRESSSAPGSTKAERGKVNSFDRARGFGFIRREGRPEVFVHYTAIQADGASLRTLSEGDEVEFEVVQGPRGLRAANVRKVSAA